MRGLKCPKFLAMILQNEFTEGLDNMLNVSVFVKALRKYIPGCNNDLK